jgi:lysophospholipase L1-like esterase
MPPAGVNRPLPWRRRVVFLAMVGGCLFLLQEVSFRLAFPLPAVPEFNRGQYMMVNYLGPELSEVKRRGLHNVIIAWESEPDGFVFHHHLNLYGFRGANFSLDPPPDRDRVLFIGDSFVEGCSAGEGDTISVQFQEQLHDTVEAINLGVAGIGIPQYVRLVRDGLALLKPDHLFLVLYANDLPTGALPPESLQPVAHFHRRNPFLPRVWEVSQRLYRGQTVPRFFPSGPYPYFGAVPSPHNALTWSERHLEPEPDNIFANIPPPPANIDPGILDAMRRGKCNPCLCRCLPWMESLISHDFSKGYGVQFQLAHVANLCRQAGASLTVVYIPYHASLHAGYLAAQKQFGGEHIEEIKTLDDAAHRRHQAHLREVTAALGLPFIDVTERLREAEQKGVRTFWAYDGHCNARGYHLIAQACVQHWRWGR